MTGEELRRVVLQTISTQVGNDGASTSVNILVQAANELKIRGTEPEQALLAFFYDLFRTGYLSWGKDLSNSDPPWFHLTQQGRKALQHISRDPANPDGYLAHLASQASLDPIAKSYVREALSTFNAQCYKAAAVMVGVASESLVLSVRDELAAKMRSAGQTVPSDLQSWQIKRVLNSIENLLTSKKTDIPRPLFEAFQSYWPAFTQQIRTIRNDAGHPNSIDPVQSDSVHAALLTFPELAKLAMDLNDWVTNHYQ